MTIGFDPDGDFADVLDGLETVTLRRRGSSDATIVTGALRRAVTTREPTLHNRYNTQKQVPSGGLHAASELSWHLPAGQLSEQPRLGDTILDGNGRRWTILNVQLTTLRTRWQCAACNLAVVYGLDDTVTILAASYAKGEGGAAEPTWRPCRTGVRARIQPAAADVGSTHEARQTRRRYQIFVEEDVTVSHNQRIQGPDGTVYRVRGSLGAQRIGELQTIDAEVIG